MFTPYFCFSSLDVAPSSNVNKWIRDYDVFEALECDDIGGDFSEYGSADPNIMPSKIPCGGCGAHLHCQVNKSASSLFFCICSIFNVSSTPTEYIHTWLSTKRIVLALY